MLSPEQVLDVSKLSLETLLYLSGPAMLVALVAGLIIGLFQALTSIQEMTLTFVPKILLVFAALLLFLPWMGDKMNAYAMELFNMIATGGTPLA